MIKKFKKYKKETINGYVHVEKISSLKKLYMAYNIGQRIFIACGYEM